MKPARAAFATGVAAGLLAACSFGGGFDGGRFRCDTAGDCPAGGPCTDGYCAPDVTPTADADSPAIDAAAGGCASVDGFTDDFSDPNRWNGFGTSALCRARVEGGRAVLTKEENGPHCGLRSQGEYPLDGADLWIQLVEADLLPAAGLEVGSEGAWLGIHLLDDSELAVAQRAEDGLDIIDSVPYEPDRHRFWRLSFAAGGFEWFTAADAGSWEKAGSGDLPAGFSPACARVQLRVAGDAGAAEDAVIFDNLNLAP